MEIPRVEPYKESVLKGDIEIHLQRTRPNSVATEVHIHSAIELLYIWEGSFVAYLNEEKHFASKGDLILIRSGTIHRVFSMDSEANSYYVIKINPSLLFDFSFSSGGSLYALEFVLSKEGSTKVFKEKDIRGSDMEDALKTMIEETESAGFGWDMAVKTAGGRLLLDILRREHTESSSHSSSAGEEHKDSFLTRQIYDAVLYINRNFAEEITAKSCGERFNMSYSYFSRSFKRITGMSFKEHLNMTRINHAEKALISSDRSVTEISAECGFNNVSYFISTYRRIKGITPYAFKMMDKREK